MKLGTISSTKKKILVVSGCSHTQGTAFINLKSTKEIRGKIHYELASDQLKAFYKKEFVTADWVSKNLTWGGKLFSLLKYDQLINFGFGGHGIDAVINSIQNYTFSKEDLTNHLFVIQVPSFERKEVLYKKNEKYGRDTYINLIRSISSDKFGFLPKDEFMSKFLDSIYDDGINQIEYLYKLYHLQRYLEALGATVRIFTRPFNKTLLTEEKQYLNFIESHKDMLKVGFQKELQKFPSIVHIYDKLNIIDLEDVTLFRTKYLKDEKIWNLHQAGLLPGDYHWTEEANAAFARCIKSNLHIKTKVKLELTPYIEQPVSKQLFEEKQPI